MSDFKQINNFWFWCQKVLPLVYDDSISYYEVLCKMSDYLNQVINNVNALPGLIDDKIKEYISSGEIENVLNEMLQNYFPIDVKNPPTDLAAAVGDGTTDDTAALQNIINYAAEHNLPMIFPGGVYRVSSLTIAEEAHFLGVGNPTIFKLNNTEDALINVEGSFTAFGMTFNANIAGVVNPVDAITGACDNVSLSNCVVTGCVSGVDASVSGIMQIVNCHFSNYTDYGVYVHGAGRILADGIIVDGVANSGAMRFVRIDTSNGIVKNLSSMASVPVGVELAGDFNSVSARIPNCENPINDGGENNNYEIIGQIKKQSFQNISENVSMNKTESVVETKTVSAKNSSETITESKTVSAKNSTETIEGRKTINGADIVLNSTNPLTYPKIPQKLNEYFNSVPFKNNETTYNVLVEGNNLDNIGNNLVNVKNFGATGNKIYYDKESNQYYADSNFKEKPNSDVEAFTDAINYAATNNIHTIFVPSGYYYLPNFTLNLSENGVTLKGEGTSFLISEGLTENSTFIQFTVTSDNMEYQASPVVLEGITILGNYFANNLQSTGVTGITFGDTWVQKRELKNIGISMFNVGIIITAVETHLNNCSIMLCDTGIYFKKTEGYNPVPCFFDNGVIELNGRGIYAPNGGYSALFISNSGISGGRQLFYGKTLLYLNNCRHEVALNSLCTNDGTPLSAIQCFGDASSDGDVGIIANNVEILTTKSGYWDGVHLFVNATEYNRTTQNNFLWEIYNPYSTLNVAALLNNVSYNPGDMGIDYIVKCQGNVIQSNNFRVSFYSNISAGSGRFIITPDNASKYSSNISKNNSGIIASNSSTITINLSYANTAVITHIKNESTFTINHSYFINDTAIDTFAISPTTSRPDGYNMTSKIPTGATSIQITIPAGTYDEFWIEII